ncbi:MAG: hypothetical protein DMG50_06385 [Acidobacteria bacterium]|nr:MAG: hypothetical protein DMG50_06385 [Acidobacteriota bacterium]
MKTEAQKAASNVAGAEIAGHRTAVSYRPATKGGCVARGALGLTDETIRQAFRTIFMYARS